MSIKKEIQTVARQIHIYVSMFVLLILLFFTFTGFTLNHRDMFLESNVESTCELIKIPHSYFNSKKKIENLDEDKLLDYISEHSNVHGISSDFQVYTQYKDNKLFEGEISVNYKSPGYDAVVYIDLRTEKAEIEMTDYGFIAKLNDLHKGRNTGELWKILIDITTILITILTLAGVCLLLPKKKMLNNALKLTLLGGCIAVVVYYIFSP
ncbi:hypothetical protein UA32_16180 [Photobacterium angustum]|uniref:Peptidase n=1 Tax=Photobacterium angustum TaxID=661 RepID=A0ABX5H8A4_PHOAN|nr:PepSY-associated TM helix domain-containing protein [Photobacterium angustum]KJG36544.1 hypothetical protein UA32_16180 [Photobacterium angustum]PSX12354.1 peptidase [Photobacterium angustum]